MSDGSIQLMGGDEIEQVERLDYEAMGIKQPSRILDQLRSYEQQVAWQQERIGELDERVVELAAQLERARAWSAAWKEAAKFNLGQVRAQAARIERLKARAKPLWTAQPAGGVATAGRIDPMQAMAEFGAEVDAILAGGVATAGSKTE